MKSRIAKQIVQPNFMRRRIQQKFRREAAQIEASYRVKKTEIILKTYRARIPVLSPKLSFRTPSFSSMPSSRFDIGRVLRGNDVAVAFERSAGAADKDNRQRIMIVLVAVAHAAAVENHRVIKQGAVAIGRRGELVDEVRSIAT
jgi:hypothetical protein